MDGEGWEWDRKEARGELMAACVTFSKLYSPAYSPFQFHLLEPLLTDGWILID